jgi:Ca-activated chloride channel family protein
MAAEEAGVAVYQVEPKSDGQGDIGSVSVRFQDMSTGEMVERRWPIPYEPGASRPEHAAASQRIATAAALFAAKLKGEPLGEVVELEELSRILSGLPERFEHMSRVQQLRLMIDQARQLDR